MIRSLVIILALSFSSLGAFASSAKAPPSQNLPTTLTEIRVDAIKSADGQVQKVLFTDMLQGKDAAKFVTLWNSLKLTTGSVKYMPQPKYRLTFYEEGGKLYGYAAISFAPDAILPLKIDYPNQFGSPIVFQNDDTAQQLHKMLARLFEDFNLYH